MAYLNKVFLIGNLTRDPELRVTPKGTAICSFGLAVNRQYRDEGGNAHEETTFVDIEAWGKQGELVAKYLTKGSPCMVEGRLQYDSWEDKATQQKRSKLKVVLDNVQFLSSGRREDQKESAAGATTGEPEPAMSQPAPGPGNRPTSKKPVFDEQKDVPF